MDLSPHHIAEVFHHAMRGVRRVTGEPAGPDWESTSIGDREATMMAVRNADHPLVRGIMEFLGERQEPPMPPPVEDEHGER